MIAVKFQTYLQDDYFWKGLTTYTYLCILHVIMVFIFALVSKPGVLLLKAASGA